MNKKTNQVSFQFFFKWSRKSERYKIIFYAKQPSFFVETLIFLIWDILEKRGMKTDFFENIRRLKKGLLTLLLLTQFIFPTFFRPDKRRKFIKQAMILLQEMVEIDIWSQWFWLQGWWITSLIIPNNGLTVSGELVHLSLHLELELWVDTWV